MPSMRLGGGADATPPTAAIGRRLFARGHRISLDAARSLVARAGSRREIVYEPDVRAGELFVAKPLLPSTRSELALPLIAHGELVGGLDVQDNEGNRFSQADVDAFSVLASQIAVALDNARLFGELKATSERLREVDDRDKLLEGIAPPSRKQNEGSAAVTP